MYALKNEWPPNGGHHIITLILYALDCQRKIVQKLFSQRERVVSNGNSLFVIQVTIQLYEQEFSTFSHDQ